MNDQIYNLINTNTGEIIYTGLIDPRTVAVLNYALAVNRVGKKWVREN